MRDLIPLSASQRFSNLEVKASLLAYTKLDSNLLLIILIFDIFGSISFLTFMNVAEVLIY